MEATTNSQHDVSMHSSDESLFGWDDTPGIVSVWASRSGKAWVWQRMGDRVHCTRETFHPWLFATTLDDLTHLGSALQLESDEATVSYRVLDGPDGSYRYLLSARDGRISNRQHFHVRLSRHIRHDSRVFKIAQRYAADAGESTPLHTPA